MLDDLRATLPRARHDGFEALGIEQLGDRNTRYRGVRNQRQRFSENLFAWYTSFRFGIKDPLCGMKVYRKVVYESLGHFDSYGSIGTELMTFAAKNHFKISQVPIKVREREGQPRFGQMLAGNYKIMRAMLLSFWRVKNTNSAR